MLANFKQSYDKILDQEKISQEQIVTSMKER